MDVAEQVKDRISCVDYIGRDVNLRGKGKPSEGICPFRAEKTGSFKVWEDHWHCFGCGAHGDIFHYYQRKHNCDFKEALQELAREAGVELRHKPEDVATYQKSRERTAILSAAVEVYRQQLSAEHRAYLHSRGFKDEFIEQYRFGFAPGGMLTKALGSYIKDDLQEIGLVNHEGRDFFWNRLIIPVYGRRSEVVNLVGRAWSDDSNGRKYLRLPAETQLLNECGLRGAETVYLCEGDTDTATLVQAGLPVVGVPGTQALKEEYVEKFKKVQRIYVCADADEAGRSLALRAGELLGNCCRIVVLPEGEDVNSYVGIKGNDITTLAAEAKPYLDYLIYLLPETIPADSIDKTLAPLFRALAKIGKGSQDVYLRQIAKRVGMGAAAIKEAFREQQTASNGKAHDLSGYQIIWRDVRLINPAQDYVDGTMLTVAFLDVQKVDEETGEQRLETVPYIVTSKRETFPATDSEAYKRGLRIMPTKVPAVSIAGKRWSIDTELSHSVKSYLDAGATVSPWEVYGEVVGYFRKFVDYPSDLYYDMLALWTIGTYFFNLYQAYPYVHLTGTKRVGKSLTLKIVAELAFNALFSSSMSSAAAYRAVESCSSTLLLDEAENLQKRSKGDDKGDDKIEILKAGYMKGPKAIRCTGDNHEPVGFDVYSPKMFGSILAMDKILADRAITLTLARKKRQLPDFDFVAAKAQMARTRDKLCILQLEHAKDVMEEIREGIGWDGVRDRERELWTPILTLAQFFDAYQLAEITGDPDPEQLLTRRMRMLAFQKGEEKLAKEQAEQTEVLMLEGILSYLKTAIPAEGNFYTSSSILTYLQGIEELAWLKDARQVTRELERVTVIQNKRRDMQRVTVNGKQMRAVRLDLKTVQEVAKRYGVEVEA